MNEHPILFSSPMIKAIIEGRKTMTRRVFKNKRVHWNTLNALCLDNALAKAPHELVSDEDTNAWRCRHCGYGTVNSGDSFIHCPHGKPGDRLWVRETWALMSRTGSDCSISYRARLPEGKTLDDTDGGCDVITAPPEFLREPDPYNWRPSIFMPRWASRITLEIIDVRVERLQDISRDDAIAEGLTQWSDPPRVVETYYGESVADVWETDPRKAYARLWDGLNAKRGFGWEQNPWVWVISFRKLTP